MSQENVGIVRALYESFDADDLDSTLEFFDPEIVWEDLAALPGSGIYRGRDEVRETVSRFYEVWGDLSFTAEEFIDAGDSVLVAHRWRGTGKSSGTPIDTLVWNLITLRDGKVIHRRAFQDLVAALEAAGLSE